MDDKPDDEQQESIHLPKVANPKSNSRTLNSKMYFQSH